MRHTGRRGPPPLTPRASRASPGLPGITGPRSAAGAYGPPPLTGPRHPRVLAGEKHTGLTRKRMGLLGPDPEADGPSRAGAPLHGRGGVAARRRRRRVAESGGGCRRGEAAAERAAQAATQTRTGRAKHGLRCEDALRAVKALASGIRCQAPEHPPCAAGPRPRLPPENHTLSRA